MRTWRHARRVLLGLFAVVVAASLASPAVGDEPVPGSAGTDTSLPRTESAVTVSGRGPFQDLRVTVNQTKNLVNQAISITWTGATPTERGASRFAAHYLQIMQCWGDDDGTNAANPGPPPEQCVQGATDAVYGGRNGGLFPAGGFALERIISRSDFEGFDPAAGYVDVRTKLQWKPFRAVDGEEIGPHYDPKFNPAIIGGNYWLNSYFDATTSNEISGGRTGPNGAGAELFQVTTGRESSGLGCGLAVQPVAGGAPKVPKCWLVVVPRGDPASENEGTPFDDKQGVMTSPLSPGAWKHRIAIPLEFTPVESACDLSDDQRQIAGNELPVSAVASWQQKLCTVPGLQPFAYATVADASARRQLQGGGLGAPGMVVVSRPLDPATADPARPVVYAPLSLSATVIGFNIERNPKPETDPAEESLRSVRVAELNLTPRLVAKLLTQSYRQQTAIKAPPPYEWVKANPQHLGVDPDFLQFNPEFALLQNGGKNFGGLVLPTGNSDAARQAWEWVLADPEAKAWLAGTPDPWGMRVNPAYATDPALNTTGGAFGDPVPDMFPKADPHCYQGPPQGPGGTVVPPPLCGTDWLPYTPSLRDAARLTRAADDRAKTSEDPFAISSDKVYKSDGPQVIGSRTILSITDSASASQYGIQMARLSRAGDDRADRTFIAPDEAGLTAGVSAMAPGAVSTVLEPNPQATTPGAYPLTVLTYAAVSPLALDTAARQDFATFVDYATGPGQVVGRELGQLPLGYAPLPAALRAQAASAAKQIRELTAPAAADDPTGPPAAAAPPAADPGGGFPVGAGTSSGPNGGSSVDSTPLAPPEAVPAELEPAAKDPEPLGLTTPILALARNRLVLPILAVVALLSALGALEITKWPRRMPPGTVPAPDEETAPA
jgi:hypothetical protein